MSTQPSRYVQPEVSEARVNRLWLNVEERLSARPSRALRWALLCGALGAAGAGALFFGRGALTPAQTAQAVASAAKLETAAEPLAVTLVDGSGVKLASHSQLQVRGNRQSAVALALTRGQVTCEVTHREGHVFTVVADDVEVRAVGTLFS